MRWPALAGLLVVLAAPGSNAAAQDWNAPGTLALVQRAVERRLTAQADSTLQSYRTRAHGFVFFLAQVGEGLTEPPRLVKADELDVEVYWQAPDRSKQVVLGWRDGTWLPTDIEYHRDHLGIVTNDFGNAIRIGEGDEVRDVPHPLSPAGLESYDFAAGDSLVIATPRGSIAVQEVRVRPRSYDLPLVVGTLYLDVATAQLVRFRFGFTPPAYLDRQLEDISVVLENSLVEGRYWLPWRQEIEIRRRATWLDFPARGIIRGRWEIGGYEINVTLPPGTFAGPTIGGLLRPQPDDPRWTRPLAEAVADVAEPVNEQDMEALRVEVERIAGTRALSGLPKSRLATGSLSDVVRFTRVQGLTLGIGATVGLGRTGLALRPRVAYGFDDERVTGGLIATFAAGSTELSLGAERVVRDFGDQPVVSRFLNSVLAQEGGRDYGDYVLLNRIALGARHRLSGRSTLTGEAAVEESRSMGVTAEPARGTFRDNPALGAGTYRIARLGLERAGAGIAVARDLQGALHLEVGEGPTEYVRATLDGRVLVRAGPGDLVSRVSAGAGSDGMPAYRSFALGGRGTLPGERFRAFAGRRAALAHVEWRLEVPIPAIRLGSSASTGRTLVLAPFTAAGWTDGPPAGPWRVSDGVRPVVGLAAEWFMRLLRVEAGVSLRTGRVGVTVDVSRDWWGLL